MKLILLSGGSGQRLWPLSNNARSKQFLKVLTNGDGARESMVQRVWRQLNIAGLAQSTYVITNQLQAEILHSQLGEHVPVIIEPERRDTFSAIALSVAYLADHEKIDPQEVMCVLPVDPYVEQEYFERIIELESLLSGSDFSMALLGVKPTYPSEKYGYILSYNGKVEQFIEKPNKSAAADLIRKGALWNCGVFAFKLQFLLDYLQTNRMPLTYGEMVKCYSQMPSRSFDYEVVEKTSNIAVLAYDREWMDLGTWNTITEEIQESVVGQGIQSTDCRNTHIINELDVPIIAIGLANLVVAASPDGILVADKAGSSRLKEFTAGIKRRPMYEERIWGWQRILDFTKNEYNQEVITRRIGIHAGKNLSYQLHHGRTEVWTVINGEGEYILDGSLCSASTGMVIVVDPGVLHTIRAKTNLELIEVQIGDQIIEEDIVREAIHWGDIVKLTEKLSLL